VHENYFNFVSFFEFAGDGTVHYNDYCFDHNFMLVKVNEGVSEDGVTFYFLFFFEVG
jgi:hypothetical protein